MVTWNSVVFGIYAPGGLSRPHVEQEGGVVIRPIPYANGQADIQFVGRGPQILRMTAVLSSDGDQDTLEVDAGSGTARTLTGYPAGTNYDNCYLVSARNKRRFHGSGKWLVDLTFVRLGL